MTCNDSLHMYNNPEVESGILKDISVFLFFSVTSPCIYIYIHIDHYKRYIRYITYYIIYNHIYIILYSCIYNI